MSTYLLRARSVIHPGNYLIQDERGECFIYFASTGELSATSVDPTLAQAMIQSYEWAAVSEEEWLTQAELQARATVKLPHVPPSTDLQHEGY